MFYFRCRTELDTGKVCLGISFSITDCYAAEKLTHNMNKSQITLRISILLVVGSFCLFSAGLRRGDRIIALFCKL